MSIELTKVNKSYGKKQVLNDISLQIEPEKIYGLLGNNGAGKSTLLNLITNRNFPSSGDISLDKEKIAENEKVLNRIYLMSEDNLIPSKIPVDSVLKLTASFYGDFDWEFANELLKDFEVPSKTTMVKLSTGYRTIVKLIAALCVPCDYIFLDEPVLGLDAPHRELFYHRLIETYEKRPRTFVISTHLIEEITNLLEEVFILHQGKILERDTIENILQKGKIITGNKEEVAVFIKENNLKVLNEEAMGNSGTFYVTGKIVKNIPQNVKVSPLSLQTYFIQITKEKRDEK